MKTFTKGQKVFAKVRGFPHWPARVEKVDASKKPIKYHVLFYGTSETACLKPEFLFDYEENKETYGIPIKRKFFNEALHEISIDTVNQTGGESLEQSSSTGVSKAESPIVASKKRKLSEVDVQDRRASPKPKPASKKSEAITNETASPPAKKVKVTESVSENDAPVVKTSRSGRQLKPKKFADEYESGPLVELRDESFSDEEPQEIAVLDDLISVKAKNGELVSLRPNADKPSDFESEEAKRNWIEERSKNIDIICGMIESGELTPKEFRKKTTEIGLFETLKEAKIKKRTMEKKQYHVRWLRVEAHLLTLEYQIKKTLQKSNPRPVECTALLQKLHRMVVAPLMLKKNPEVLRTLFKCQNYVPDSKVRENAKQALKKLQSLFEVPEGQRFADVFAGHVRNFEEATKDWDEKTKLWVVDDPTSHKEDDMNLINE